MKHCRPDANRSNKALKRSGLMENLPNEALSLAQWGEEASDWDRPMLR